MKSYMLVLFLVAFLFSCSANEDVFPGLPFENHDFQGKLFSGKIEDAFGEYPELLSALQSDERKVVGYWIDYDRMDKSVAMNGVYPTVHCEIEIYPNHVIRLSGSRFSKSGNEIIARLVHIYGIWKVNGGILSSDFYSMRYGHDSGNLTGYAFKKPLHWDVIKTASINDLNYTTNRIAPFPTSQEFTLVTGIPRQSYRWFIYRSFSDWDEGIYPTPYRLREPLKKMIQSRLRPIEIVSNDAIIKEIWY